MNVVVPLTNLGFLKDFYYPTAMQIVAGKTVLEHSIESLKIAGQYRFVINWDDHTKYSLGNYIEKAFPGAMVVITKNRTEGAADAVLSSGVIDGPLVVFDGRSQLLFNGAALLNRVVQARADAAVAVYANRKFAPHIRIGGYHHNSVSRIVWDRSKFATAGLYYFGDARHYFNAAPQVIRDELEMEYRPIEPWDVLNHLLGDGCKVLYHRVARRGLETVEQLAKFSN